MKLSVAIATHNEEDNITRTLKSIYDWVDEIVVIDGKSTDKTVEVIKKFDTDHKIKLFNEDNPAMFHINKQKAIERCSGAWILQLDADEVVSDDLKNEILAIVNLDSGVANAPQNDVILASRVQTRRVQNPRDDIVAFWIPRLNYFLNKPLTKGGQYPDYTIRLYKNGVARFPCKDVHEQVEIITNNQLPITNENSNIENSLKIENLKLKIGHLKRPLLHYPYRSFDDYLTKWVRYCDLEAELLYQKETPLTWMNFFLYIFYYPDAWFVKTFIRHRGYVDGFAGFVFSLFSALRYRVIYIKLYERYHR